MKRLIVNADDFGAEKIKKIIKEERIEPISWRGIR